MKRITNLQTYSQSPAALALGCFDGVHLGHRAVLECAVADAQKGLVPTVFTFAQHPMQMLKGEAVPSLLTTGQQKALFTELGIEQMYAPSFSEVRDIEAQAFVQHVLKEICNAKTVYCGFNFHFGKGGTATAQDLRRLSGQYGIAVEILPAVTDANGMPISSSAIRRCLQQGQIETATAMLGWYFGYCNTVIQGNRLGRTLGFPTINQTLPQGLIQPKQGVYASLITLENGRKYHGVTNIGVRPTVEQTGTVLSETRLFAFEGDLYGTAPKVELVHFLRAEQKFNSLPELARQIEKDQKKAAELLLRACPLPGGL